MRPLIQVWDGADDGYYAEIARKQDLREQTYSSLERLVRDLRQSANYLPTPGAVTNRLVFIDELIGYLKGRERWSAAEIGYRDLQEICSLYVAMNNREGMVAQLSCVLNEIKAYREVVDAA